MGLTQRLGTIPLAIQTDSSNNVGIGGTPSGTYGKLSVFGGVSIKDDNNAKLEIGRYSSGASNSYIKLGANSNSLRISNATDSADLITFTNSGNVGIGTTTPALTTSNRTTLDIGNATESILVLSTGGSWRSYFYNDGTNLSIANSGGFINFDVLGERMRITNTGRVGINTSTPQRTFDARGAVNLSTTAPSVASTSGAYADLHLRTWSGATSSPARISVVDNWMDYVATFTDGHRFRNYSSDGVLRDLVTIAGGGDVGIGGSISGQKLYVKAATANGSTNAFLIHDSNGSDLLFVRSDGLITTGGAVSPYNFNPGGRVMYVNSSGQVGSNPSTRESKININPISDVSYIYDLNPVSFYFRKTNMETYEYTDEYYDEIRYGFIADEVEPLNPDLVSYNVNEDGTKKMAGVEYISMIPVLVKALQEQKKLIDNLSAKVTALENK